MDPLVDYRITIVFLAFLLDVALGDPTWLYHPVRVIGHVIDLLERPARRLSLIGLKASGAVAVLFLTAAVYTIISMIIGLDGIGIILAVWLAYSGLALKCLLDEGERVRRFLQAGDVEGARQQLGYLVSRDTSQMEESDIRRSLAETLSENFSDGFVAPFFYLVLFGPAAQWAYKAVNTFDSMWGYRNERFRELGWFAARLDDVLNYVPARLSVLLLMAARLRFGMKLWRDIASDARTMGSPNAGWPMAACAYLIGSRMGGPTVYDGVVKDKPVLGSGGDWGDAQLETLRVTLLRAGWIALGCALLLLTFFI
ncbi:adenosylcobinamide-phosphate synthase CbiB [Salidesulfovibrio brasiliensis]|uniref:adenosylcobinamide-phosphate synthase CbiB n=1 Tax=Salidesulfovibrio brasiliensis TaxID=221711 RepID=UPI0006D285F1|nr:adenosylcobinamide-phosphate synthase CbiB [Salidesulfovibrio brasiliensis]